MLKRLLLCVVAGTVLTPTAALACGALASGGRAELSGFEALLSFNGSHEELVVTIDYEAAGSEEGFAWLMPFSSPPEVAKSSEDALRTALEMTEPPRREDHVPSVLPSRLWGVEQAERATEPVSTGR